MPPRFAYWTILIDGKPTAFRARYQQELLPTFHQLKRTNKDILLRWFARGKLWESPEAERAWRKPKSDQTRNRDWRPGGQHKDPRQRFRDQKRQRNQERRAERHEHRERDAKSRGAQTFRSAKKMSRPPGARASRPAGDRRPFGPGARPVKLGKRPFAAGPPRGDQTWSGKPREKKSQRDRKPWSDRPPRRKFPSERGSVEPGRDETPRRIDEERPPAKKRESPEQPPPPEQIVIKPEPPERG